MDKQITWLSIIVDQITRRRQNRRNLAASVNMADYGKALYLYKRSQIHIIINWPNIRQHAMLPKRKLRTDSQDALVRHINGKNQRNVTATSPWISIRLGKCGTLEKNWSIGGRKPFVKGEKILKWFIAIPQLSIWPSARIVKFSSRIFWNIL